MDRLPPEVFDKILGHLDIDQIKLCRHVSKLFRSMVNDCLRIKNLVISDKKMLTTNRWSFNDELISYQNWIDEDGTGFRSGSDLFKNIKRLYIETFFRNDTISLAQKPTRPSDYGSAFLKNLIGLIDKFKQLEIIEIVSMESDASVLNINLPKLKIFHIGPTRFLSVKLNTPKLICLKTSRISLSKVQIVHPQTVKYLEIDNYDPLVKNFKNLENLCCFRFATVEPDLPEQLTQLKQIHFMQDRSLLPQFKHLKSLKKGLNVYFFGLEISSINPPSKLHFDSELDGKELMYLVENVHLTANRLPFFKTMNYNKLENKTIRSHNFVNQPVLNKFGRLTSVTVNSSVCNRGLLMGLFLYCKNLQKIDVNYSAGLSAKNFNQIIDYQPNVELLRFFTKKKSVKLHMESVARLERLTHLDVNKRFNLEELRAFCEVTFKKTKLYKFGFYHNHAFCEIMYDDGEFSIEVENDGGHTDTDKYDNLDDLFGWISEGLSETFDHYQYKRRRDLGPSSDESDYDPKRKGKSLYDPDSDLENGSDSNRDSDGESLFDILRLMIKKKKRV